MSATFLLGRFIFGHLLTRTADIGSRSRSVTDYSLHRVELPTPLLGIFLLTACRDREDIRAIGHLRKGQGVWDLKEVVSSEVLLA